MGPSWLRNACVICASCAFWTSLPVVFGVCWLAFSRDCPSPPRPKSFPISALNYSKYDLQASAGNESKNELVVREQAEWWWSVGHGSQSTKIAYGIKRAFLLMALHRTHDVWFQFEHGQHRSYIMATTAKHIEFSAYITGKNSLFRVKVSLSFKKLIDDDYFYPWSEIL